MRVMRDKADLVERLEATEHQLLQLQGETDTIGQFFIKACFLLGK